MKTERIYALVFASVYPWYIKKAERKGRTKDEVDTIICWLTGYDRQTLQKQIDKKVDFQTFFNEAPYSIKYYINYTYTFNSCTVTIHITARAGSTEYFHKPIHFVLHNYCCSYFIIAANTC